MVEKRHSGVPGGGGGGADVKSGIVSVPTATPTTVTFLTAFATVPHVVVCFETFVSEEFPAAVSSRLVGSFVIEHDIGSTKNVLWIATDAGNP